MRQRNVAVLWFGGLITFAGDWVLLIGLPIYVYTVTGSTLATGIAFLSGLLPTLLLGSVAGVFVDRWDRRRILIIVDVLFALGLLPLLLVHSAGQIWIVYLVQFVESCLGQLAGPAVSALIPQLVEEERLPALYSLNALSLNLARLAGPLLGGLVVEGLGLTGVALADSASFLLAALSVALVRLPATARKPSTPGVGARSWTAVWGEWWDGLRLVRSSQRLTIIFAVMAITSVGEGVLGTLYAPFVTRVLHGTGVQYGWLNSGQAVGGLISSAVGGSFGSRVTPARVAALGHVGLGVVTFALFDYPLVISGILPALVLIVIGGILSTPGMANFITLLQTSVEDTYRGRIWGAFLATEGGGRLVGAVVAGVLGDRVGIIPLLNLQAGGLVIGGLLIWLMLDRRSPAGTQRVEGASRQG